jgi:hypothetical protein
MAVEACLGGSAAGCLARTALRLHAANRRTKSDALFPTDPRSSTPSPSSSRPSTTSCRHRDTVLLAAGALAQRRTDVQRNLRRLGFGKSAVRRFGSLRSHRQHEMRGASSLLRISIRSGRPWGLDPDEDPMIPPEILDAVHTWSPGDRPAEHDRRAPIHLKFAIASPC